MTDLSTPVGRPPRPRRRIIDAARELAARGGYESLQVRALSECARVSSYTIYAHFASLESLLIVALDEQSQDLYRRYIASPPPGDTAVARVDKLTEELTETMNASRNLAVAWLRALVSGKPDVAPWVAVVMDSLQTLVASAIAPHGPTEQDREVAEILGSIWFRCLSAGRPAFTTNNKSPRSSGVPHALSWSEPTDSGPPGTRTRNLRIKSPSRCQLRQRPLVAESVGERHARADRRQPSDSLGTSKYS